MILIASCSVCGFYERQKVYAAPTTVSIWESFLKKDSLKGPFTFIIKLHHLLLCNISQIDLSGKCYWE
jgi:hypothetical protein